MKKRLTLALLILLYSITNVYAATGKVYIFVSFSMPKESIKGWMNEAQKIDAAIVIRGLINNSFKDTVQRVTEFTKDNKGGVQLNPPLFERYQIDKVPAVVVASDTNCLPIQTCKEEYDVVYGDITLAYALKKIADRNDPVSEIAASSLSKLRDRHEI